MFVGMTECSHCVANLMKRPGFLPGASGRTLPVKITRKDLEAYLETLDRVDEWLEKNGLTAALAQYRISRRIAIWAFNQTSRQEAGGQPEAVAIPPDLKPTKLVLRRTKKEANKGRRELDKAFHRLMREDPEGTIRNVCPDLFDLVGRAAGGTVFVDASKVIFHLRLTIPTNRRVIILDATANADLLRAVFAPRPVKV